MDGKLGLERLFRWTRMRAEPQAVDAADMGTAYGMELTIDACQQAADEAKAKDAAARAKLDASPARRLG